MESEWCRVRQFYAGPGYGAFFIPEVGDEVLIAFTHGDMRLPIVLGGLYNSQDTPPSHRADDKDEKMIRTKAGHQLTFVDTQGEQAVRLQSNGGHLVELDDQNQHINIQSSGGHSVNLDDQSQKITISTSGGSTITMDSSGITLQANAKVSIEAPDIELGSGASHALILGDEFMALFNAHVHPTAAPGPPSPPATPMLPVMLSLVTKTT